MFCTSAPPSTTPPRPRVRRGSIADDMARQIHELALGGSSVLEQDIEAAGFTKAEIAAYGEDARAKVRQLFKAAA